MKKSKPIDPELKAKALELADQVGAAEAARQLGLSAGTIRAWKSREGRIDPPAGVDVEDWAKAKRDGAQASWRTGEAALREALKAIEEGRTLDAQRLMLTAGIAADKTGQLTEAADRAEERLVRISENQGEQIAEVIRLALEDLDLDHDAVRRVFAARLEGGANLDAAERAKAQIRREIEREIGADGAPARRREPLALPPASAPHPDGREDEEREEMTPPKKVITTSKPDVVVDAEVVDPDSDPYMPLSVEKSPERDSHRWS